MSGPSDKASVAAHTAFDPDLNRDGDLVNTDLVDALNAAHDPSLGLDRSVCAQAVLDRLREKAEAPESDAHTADAFDAVADWFEREFGGES